MNIESTVLPGAAINNYAENQPEYRTLPTVIYPQNPQGPVTSRWSFTQEEREAIAKGADLYLTILTFRSLLQPILMQIFETTDEAGAALRAQGYIPDQRMADEEAK